MKEKNLTPQIVDRIRFLEEELSDLRDCLALLKQESIIIVSIQEYRKIKQEISSLKKEIQRCYIHGQTVSQRAEVLPQFPMSAGQGVSRSSKERRKGHLSLVHK